MATIIWDTTAEWGARKMHRTNADIDRLIAPGGSVDRYYLVTPWGPMCLEQFRKR